LSDRTLSLLTRRGTKRGGSQSKWERTFRWFPTIYQVVTLHIFMETGEKNPVNGHVQPWWGEESFSSRIKRGLLWERDDINECDHYSPK